MTNQSCGSCKFFSAAMLGPLGVNGMCRRYPPVLAVVPSERGPQQQWFFPIVDPDKSWCGEHKVKIELQ